MYATRLTTRCLRLDQSIIFKGSPSLNLTALPESITAAAIVGTASVVTLFAFLFWVPYVHAKVIKKDYTVKWYHFFHGPLLWKRQVRPFSLTA